MARQPAHFRLPARHGWGRLAHGSATEGLAEDSVVSEAEVDRRRGVQHTDTVTRRGGRARLKASDSKSDRGASPSGVQILSPPPI
jgi:hypothetical protein